MTTAAFVSTCSYFSLLYLLLLLLTPLLLAQVLHFYFNAEQKGNSPTQFKEETTSIDFPEEVGNPLYSILFLLVIQLLLPVKDLVILLLQVTKYTAALTSIWDGDHSGLHLNLKTESSAK